MLKLAYRYDQTAARLMVEGLPDISADHGQGVIGILSSWKLQFVGSEPGGARTPRSHAGHGSSLRPLRAVGCDQAVRGPESPVSLSPAPLVVTSSQQPPGVEPPSIQLDDAELADLVRVSMLCALIPACNCGGPERSPARAPRVGGTDPLDETDCSTCFGWLCSGGCCSLGVPSAFAFTEAHQTCCRTHTHLESSCRLRIRNQIRHQC